MPSQKIVPNYYVMEWKPWCNIVAVTASREIILIEQYRHAGGKTFIEIPGGTVDSGSPLECAKRELREETGYTSDEFRFVGAHFPNPAILSNELHTYIALNCRKVGEPQLDEFEDIRVFTTPLEDAYKMLSDGKISHSLVMVSLYMAKSHLT